MSLVVVVCVVPSEKTAKTHYCELCHTQRYVCNRFTRLLNN